MKEQNIGGNISQNQYWKMTQYKLLCDFNIMTDKKITARRPDIVIVNKGQRKTTFIDIACPCDRNVNDKETGKVEKYQDLKIDIFIIIIILSS